MYTDQERVRRAHIDREKSRRVYDNVKMFLAALQVTTTHAGKEARMSYQYYDRFDVYFIV